MSKLTKIELVQINSALSAENSALRAELSTLRVQRVADSTPRAAPTGSWAERAAHARAEAMRTGKTVRM